mgnify:CR=1 FL=1
MPQSRSFLFLFMALALLLPAFAGATVAVRAPIEALADEASHVVHARVVDRRVVPERGPHGEIRTRATLRVLTYLRGSGPETLTVQQLGGTLEGYTLRVLGNARLEPGDEVVAFLDVDGAAGLAYVVAMAQGVWQVERGDGPPRVHRDLSGLAFYQVGPVPVSQGAPIETLTDLVAALGVSAPPAEPATVTP